MDQTILVAEFKQLASIYLDAHLIALATDSDNIEREKSYESIQRSFGIGLQRLATAHRGGIKQGVVVVTNNTGFGKTSDLIRYMTHLRDTGFYEQDLPYQIIDYADLIKEPQRMYRPHAWQADFMAMNDMFSIGPEEEALMTKKIELSLRGRCYGKQSVVNFREFMTEPVLAEVTEKHFIPIPKNQLSYRHQKHMPVQKKDRTRPKNYCSTKNKRKRRK